MSNSAIDADAAAIAKIKQHGWQQGSVLGRCLAARARDAAPGGVSCSEADWFVVISHDCDILNKKRENEPVVEILRAEVQSLDPGVKTNRSQTLWGRNPRKLTVEEVDEATRFALTFKAHERWPLDRMLLATEPPLRRMSSSSPRLIAEWLAKRYIRSAFPTAFDERWHDKMKDWVELLRRHQAAILGIYLQLSTHDELPDDQPYHCDLVVAAHKARVGLPGWATEKAQLENEIEQFWKQCDGIECDGVDVLGPDELTLETIQKYQRFDADWVSRADDSDSIPMEWHLLP